MCLLYSLRIYNTRGDHPGHDKLAARLEVCCNIVLHLVRIANDILQHCYRTTGRVCTSRKAYRNDDVQDIWVYHHGTGTTVLLRLQAWTLHEDPVRDARDLFQ